MPQPALTKAQQRRLEKLARDAGRTPQAMLRFVLRYTRITPPAEERGLLIAYDFPVPKRARIHAELGVDVIEAGECKRRL
ncbi:MAG: hypothetical protein HY848_04950 [Betaproteobacteria bacterium]|nr:hypothetical protein [Betaproteobacteria bacterium]